MKNRIFLPLVFTIFLLNSCFCQTIWYDGNEIADAVQIGRRGAYFGLDVGMAVNENVLTSNETGGLRPLECDEKLVGNFYLKLGVRKKRSLYEINYGFLQNQFRFQTPRGIGEINTKDYNYGAIKYYYLLTPKNTRTTFYAGGGLNSTFLTKDQNTFGDGGTGTWVSTYKDCPSCPPDVFTYSWEPTKERKTFFMGLECDLKADIQILKRLNLTLWSRGYLWNKREVLEGEVTTKDNNQPQKISRVSSKLPVYGFGIGLSWNMGGMESYAVPKKEPKK